MTTDMWSAYVRRLLDLSELQEAAFVRELAVQQGTFNRWKNGASKPDKAADVAQFATDCKRNVLEAFVAAGMITEDQAGQGLPADSRRFLAGLRDEGGSTALTVSGPSPIVPDAMAAHDEEVSIAGEQEESDTP